MFASLPLIVMVSSYNRSMQFDTGKGTLRYEMNTLNAYSH